MIEVDVKGRVGGFSVDAKFTGAKGVTALFGQSGAGKSTITNMIAGLLRPNSGRIVVNGEILFDSGKGIDIPARARRVGQVFQDSRLFPHLSVKSNLTFARWAGRRHDDSRSLDEVVDLLGIGHLLDRKPGGLSGGERQRVAIGRALLSAPRLLLMDEPLASLDQGRKADILPYLDRVRSDAGIPILYVSHAMEEVARLAQTLVIISEGRTVACGPVAEILTRLDLGQTAGLEEPSAILEGAVSRIDPDWGLTSIDIGGQSFQIPGLDATPGEAVRLRVLARDVAIALAEPKDVSVRNVFKGEITNVTHESGPYTEILSRVGEQTLRARVTRASAHELALEPGKTVYLLVKSVAIDRRQLAPASGVSTVDATGPQTLV